MKTVVDWPNRTVPNLLGPSPGRTKRMNEDENKRKYGVERMAARLRNEEKKGKHVSREEAGIWASFWSDAHHATGMRSI